MPILAHKTLPLHYAFDDTSLLGGDRLQQEMRRRWRELGIHVDLQQGVWWTDNDDLLEQAIPRGASADSILALADRMAGGRKAAQNPQSVIDFTDHIPREPSFTITEVAVITGRGTRSLFEREPHEGTKARRHEGGRDRAVPGPDHHGEGPNGGSLLLRGWRA
jgi:hypothetical protein